jgi:AcrR family transcriptional regulator
MDTGSTGHKDKPRRRDAAATRQSLLMAARVLVAQHGVEGTSTRDVATAAGVNQALVYRYFGSKEKLFAEAVGGGPNLTGEVIADTPLADLPHVLLGHALDVSAATGERGSGISTFVTAANDDTIRTILRERISVSFGTELAARLDGPDATLRAELLAALITGIGFLREKVGTPAIASADRETLGAYVDRMAETLLAAEPVPAERDRG